MDPGFEFRVSSFSKYMRLAIITLLVVAADQITKYMVLESMPLFQSIPVIPGLFNLTHIHNPGGAFGFLSGQSSHLQRLIFLLASSLAIGLILYFYMKTPQSFRFLSIGLALVFSGAIGNLIDRIRMGKVVDFLDFYVGNFHWPAFNIADSAVSVGMFIFLYHLFFKKLPE